MNISTSTTVDTADFSAAPSTSVVNAATPLTVTNQWKIPDGNIATLTGGSSFTIAGGNILIDSAATPRTLTLTGGTLSFAANPYVLASSSFWLDASASNTIAQTAGALSRWNSKATAFNNGAYVLPRNINTDDTNLGTPVTPINVSYLPTGGPLNQPVVQTGALSSGNYLRFKDASDADLQLSDIRSVFWVVKGGGFLLGDNPSATNVNDFHRGGNGSIGTNGGNPLDPLILGFPNFGSGTAPAVSMDWYLDATPINPRVATMPVGYSVIDAVQPTTTAASLHAGAISVSNTNGCCNAHTGGTYISELLIFNTTLSTTDRLAVEEYLNKKWILGETVTAGIHYPNMNIVATATSTLDFGSSSVVGSMSVNGGSTVLNLNHAQSTTLNDLSGDGTLVNIDTATPASLTLVAASGAASFSGTIQSGGANGIVNLIKTGAATQSFPGPGTINLDTLKVTDGILNTNGNVTVNTADFSAGTGVVSTGAGALTIISQMLLANNITATLTGAASFTASGNNIVIDSAATPRTLTLSGGNLAMSSSAISTLLQTAQVWLDPSITSSLSGTNYNGAGIGTYKNIGTAGGTVANSTDGRLAKINPSVTTNAFGSLSGIRLSNSADIANQGSLLQLSGFNTTGNTISTFVVAKQTGLPSGNGEMSLVNISAGGTTSPVAGQDYLSPAFLLEVNPGAPSNGRIGVRRDPTARPVVNIFGATQVTNGNAPFIVDAIYDGTVGSVALKTSAAAATLSTNVADTGSINGGFYLGRQYFNDTTFPGDVGEVLVFTTALSSRIAPPFKTISMPNGLPARRNQRH